MAPAIREVARPRAGGRIAWPGLAPALTLAVFLLPIGAGLLGIVLPAFGWLPALGGERFGVSAWLALFAQPELPRALVLTLWTGIAATAAAVWLTLGFAATCHGRPLFVRLSRLIAPLLAVPHAATAIGLAFLIAPSGWLARLATPWATGSMTPPDIGLDRDPYGAALILGLIVKEVPFLLLMTVGALGQIAPDRSVAAARALGYSPTAAWLKCVLPRLYPQLRLPIFAVLAYALSVIDMALVLGPATLAPLVLRWINDPDLAMRFPGAAAALLQLLLVVGATLLWLGAERCVALIARPWLYGGRRGGAGWPQHLFGGAAVLLFVLAAGCLVVLALWSLAARWRFPDALPQAWTLGNWSAQLGRLAGPTVTTLAVGALATLIALALVIGCLENEQRRGQRLTQRGLWLLYLPLLVPQISFMFGTQVLLIAGGLDGGWAGLVWSHLLFVLPYVFLALGDPYRALDPRFARAALALGVSPWRVLWRVKLPLLLAPVLFAAAVGFSVSVALYVPTLFAGGGRHATLATEAVALFAGADRRAIGVYGFAQAVLPLVAYAIALAPWGRPR